ncbi:hypothetical protein HII31_12488 [Pseudocercospora fuligena]|uniref:Uncharacterized protein n=1 Tax=Pseudocercospora fuligena TaxID=685502 RepID=A0A8H6R589_9PEZI|nr:hypothetical protein HII31_12488 [Pseudocercospora fuligena]
MDESHLLALSPELLEEIIRIINIGGKSERDSAARVSALAALSSTSKTLHHAVRPYLYSRFNARTHGLKVQLLVRTLYERPDLIRHLEHLAIAPAPSDEDLSPISESILADFRHDDYYHEIWRTIKYGSRATYMGVLLALATNIESLYVDLEEIDTYDKGELWPIELKDVLTFFLSQERLSRLSKSAYRRLTYATICGRTAVDETYDRGFSADILLHFMALPHLRTLEASSMSSDEDDSRYVDQPFSSVSSILLRAPCNINIEQAVAFIRACKKLERFELEFQLLYSGNSDDQDEAEDFIEDHDEAEQYYFSLAELQRALHVHSQHLTRFQLICKDKYEVVRRLWQAQQPLDLRHFTALRHLEVDSRVLPSMIGPNESDANESLPPDLTSLTLHSLERLEELPKYLHSLITYEAQKFKELKITFRLKANDHNSVWAVLLERDEANDHNSAWTVYLNREDMTCGDRQWYLGKEGNEQEGDYRICFWAWSNDHLGQKPMSNVLSEIECLGRIQGVGALFEMQCPQEEEK